MSISIEEHLTPGRCQVTAMAVSHNELYVGTTWGCLVVAEGSTMRPITVFRPHDEEIKAIVPFESSCASTSLDQTSEHDVFAQQSNSKDSPGGDTVPSSPSANTASPTQMSSNRYIVTVGKGFRSLVSRYIYLSKERRSLLTQRGVYAILWKTGNWLN
jgi:hypothetical protein